MPGPSMCSAIRLAGRRAPSGYAPVIIAGAPGPIILISARWAATAHATRSRSGTGPSIGIVITCGHGTSADPPCRGVYQAVATALRPGTGDRDASFFFQPSALTRGGGPVALR